jgi:hypothetical protein
MKHLRLNFIGMLMFLILFCEIYSVNSFSQRVVNVPQGFGTLNDAIDGDTTSTGDRIDVNTKYVLERGGFYILNGAIQNAGYPLHVEAAEGEGARPILIPGVGDGGVADIPFNPRGSLYMKDLYVTGIDELGGIQLRIIRIQENNVRLVIENCHIDFSSQAAIRVDGTDTKIFMMNSIFSNHGQTSSRENGRVVDDRGNSIDTLVGENSTFYNVTFRLLRDGGGDINYARFNHNTIYNIGYGAIDLGAVNEAYVTNNVFHNTGFYGEDGNSVPNFDIEILAPTDVGVTQVAEISNNNFFIDPALVSAFPDSVDPIIRYSSLAETFLDAGTELNENLAFADAPNSPVDVVTSFWSNPSGAQPPIDTTANKDFIYPNTAASFTASTAGQPLGDLNWFGLDIITSVENFTDGGIPTEFTLYNNYPNPFNPSTTIRYSIPSQGFVSLKIYDVLGKEVASLINTEQPAGFYEVRFDAAELSSGIYFYQLETGSFIQSKKMLLMK